MALTSLWKRPASQERLEALRKEAAEVTASLTDARAKLGDVVADGDETATAKLRLQIGRAQARMAELGQAIPVVERRIAAALAREAAAVERTALREQNALRDRRLRAARNLDAAMETLDRAYTDYVATDAGLTGSVRERVSKREKFSLQAAFFKQAPGLASSLGIQRPSPIHWRTLAASESGMLPVHDVPNEEE